MSVSKLERRQRDDLSVAKRDAAIANAKAQGKHAAPHISSGDDMTGVPWSTVSQALNLSLRLARYNDTREVLCESGFALTLVHLTEGLQREARAMAIIQDTDDKKMAPPSNSGVSKKVTQNVAAGYAAHGLHPDAFELRCTYC